MLTEGYLQDIMCIERKDPTPRSPLEFGPRDVLESSQHLGGDRALLSLSGEFL
jgi:hypothetical protein